MAWLSSNSPQLRHYRKGLAGSLLALVGLCGFSQLQAQMVLDPVVLNGLQDEVRVLTPGTSVPTIVANNRLDAAFVEGYVQAQNRFFQMDVTRRAVSGTLAELFGTAVLADDIQLRTLGLRRSAWQTYAALGTDPKAILQAYANGVNAWLANNPLPPEYGALELTQADDWSPVDSLVIGKGLAFQLSFDLSDIDLTVALGTYQAVGQVVGFDGTALFFEDTHRAAPPDDRVSIPGFLNSIGGLGKSASVAKTMSEMVPDLNPEQLALASQFLDQAKSNPMLAEVLSLDAERKGSNWWIADGSITESGYPMYANDPHLTLNTASTFVPAHVVVADAEGNTLSNASGVSVPGVPGIIQGCTENLCWGSTVNPIDETDAYFETLRVNNFGLPTHTVYQGQEEPLVLIFQSYFANQLGDGEFDNVERQTVSYTGGAITFVVPRRNNGPIVSINTETGQGISIQYTGWGPTFELEAFFDINNAQTVADFQQALTKFDVGSQNFGVADTNGDIAYFSGAELPLRTDLQTLNAPDGGIPPVLIRDGSGQLQHEWLPLSNPQPNQAVPYEVLPLEEMPQVINPALGYVVNANNDPVGTTLDNNALNQVRPGGGLYYLNGGIYSSYRMGRIDRLMQDAVAQGPISLSQFKAFQANNQMLDAELVIPFILDAFSNASAADAWPQLAGLAATPGLDQVMSLFADWDFSTPTGIPEGYDPGDNPFALADPSQTEIDYSVAAAVFSVWRGQMIQNSIDATLGAVGLGENLPNSLLGYNALVNLLASFEQNQGIGASGLNFFTNPDAPTAADARDLVILASLRSALDLMASDEFAPAFDGSTDVMDYRWGKLHRIVFDHPLSGPFDLPNPDGLYGISRVPGLAGAPRSGGYQVLDASGHSTRADGVNEFMFGAGPARRFVGTLTPDGVVAEQIVPGGQSGVLGSPLYANQLYSWLVNAYFPIFLDATVVEGVADTTQTFTPPGS